MLSVARDFLYCRPFPSFSPFIYFRWLVSVPFRLCFALRAITCNCHCDPAEDDGLQFSSLELSVFSSLVFTYYFTFSSYHSISWSLSLAISSLFLNILLFGLFLFHTNFIFSRFLFPLDLYHLSTYHFTTFLLDMPWYDYPLSVLRCIPASIFRIIIACL